MTFIGALSLTKKKINFALLISSSLFSSYGQGVPPPAPADSGLHIGPLFDEFPLTIGSGTRSEMLGPLFAWESEGTTSLFTFSPVYSLFRDTAVDQTEAKVFYPAISFQKFGTEYRFHLFQVISWSGGESMKGGDTKRTTFFPVYFKQTSPRPEENYTAVLPFYGEIKNRFFRDDIRFIMMPLYVETTKRGMVTENFVFPLVHVRHGAGVSGWQFWPLYGTEHKEITTSTNNWGDSITSGGYDKKFVLWPFYFNNTLGIGTTNVQRQFVMLPFYTSQVSTTRVSKSYGFPIGVTHTIDHEQKYEEWDAPWPLVEFAKGEGKNTRRVFPFFSNARAANREIDWYLWPVYRRDHLFVDTLDRQRTRILLFLYSDITEQDKAKKTSFERRDFWPLYTWRKDHKNNSRLQILSILEPILIGNKSIERIYSPIYSLYREEHNGTTGDQSRSVLWNLYRSESRGETRKQRAFFGLFQREKTPEKTNWRIFFIPFSTSKNAGQRSSSGATPVAE